MIGSRQDGRSVVVSLVATTALALAVCTGALASCGGASGASDGGRSDGGADAARGDAGPNDASAEASVEASADAGPGDAGADGARRVDFFVSSHNGSAILRMQGAGHVESWQVIDSANPDLYHPHGLALDSQGTLWVSNGGNDNVRAYPGGVAPGVSFGTLSTPIGLTLGPDGDVYVTAYWANGIYRSTRQSPLTLTPFVPTGSPFIHHPSGVQFGPDGLMYVTDNLSHQIAQVDPNTGGLLSLFGTDAGMLKPEGLTFGADGLLYVVEYTNARVVRFDVTTQSMVDVFVPAPSGNLRGPIGIVFGPDGRLYICSFLTNSIEMFDGVTGQSLGPFVSSADGTPLDSPTWMVFVKN